MASDTEMDWFREIANHSRRRSDCFSLCLASLDFTRLETGHLRMTERPTAEGKVYLAAVIDAFFERIDVVDA
jgi:hypothetical protein